MQCRKCGKENPEMQRYCMNCGVPLVLDDTEASGKTVIRRRKRKTKSLIITMLILCPLLLFLIFILLCFFLGSGA